MKKSIILLITLALIIAITSLIAIGLTTVDKTTKQVERKHFLIQTSTFINNVGEILKKKSGDINRSEGFDLLINMPIDLKSDSIHLHITFNSAAKGVNPNNLIKKSQNKFTIDPNYLLLFDRILQSKNVQNKELFLAMLEDTLDSDLEERLPGSEIALYDRRFRQGKIEDYTKFIQIVDHYVKITEDPTIYSVDWKKILDFYSNDIDFNYIEPKLLSYMLPYLDAETIIKVTNGKEELFDDFKDIPLASEYKNELKKYHIKFFVPILYGQMEIKQGDYKSWVHFIYDIEEKRIKEVEYKVN